MYKNINDVFQTLMERDQLPVKQFEEEIMTTINNNPVVIIRGATGCGKTTQVPQYILDRFIKGGKASDCNIVVTQVTLNIGLPNTRGHEHIFSVSSPSCPVKSELLILTYIR